MSAKTSSQGRSPSRLVVRRRRQRLRAIIALTVLGVIVLGAIIYGIWQPAVRVSHVAVYNTTKPLAEIATSTMQGSYLGIIPRNSIFFVPEGTIRQKILSAYPDVAAVSVFRSGFSSISIKVDKRVAIARWCNVAEPFGTTTPAVPCYLFDANGFVYATSTASSSPLNAFSVDEPVSGYVAPVGKILPDASRFPAAFDFARQLTSFGSSVQDIVFRGDEIDDYLQSGTRVTYVSGSEQTAYAALISAKKDFNLADGSIEYIDLRFPGKIYLKRVGAK